MFMDLMGEVEVRPPRVHHQPALDAEVTAGLTDRR
jgi:hypothetical protein